MDCVKKCVAESKFCMAEFAMHPYKAGEMGELYDCIDSFPKAKYGGSYTIVRDESALEESDPAELRAALLRVVDEMTWVGSIRGLTISEGIAWPPDAEERIKRLRAALAAWSPAGPLPLRCLRPLGRVS
jgi:hypothetical protein